jgi:hypothetical protein
MTESEVMHCWGSLRNNSAIIAACLALLVGQPAAATPLSAHQEPPSAQASSSNEEIYGDESYGQVDFEKFDDTLGISAWSGKTAPSDAVNWETYQASDDDVLHVNAALLNDEHSALSYGNSYREGVAGPMDIVVSAERGDGRKSFFRGLSLSVATKQALKRSAAQVRDSLQLNPIDSSNGRRQGRLPEAAPPKESGPRWAGIDDGSGGWIEFIVSLLHGTQDAIRSAFR